MGLSTHSCCTLYQELAQYTDSHTRTYLPYRWPEPPHYTWQSWHETGVRSRLKRLLRVPTATVLYTSLPRVIINDGMDAPDKLNFEINPAWLPTSMYSNALILVNSQKRFILEGVTTLCGAGTLDTGGRRAYYVLSPSQDEHKKISHPLIKKCVCMHAHACTAHACSCLHTHAHAYCTHVHV